jgi:hypothetical protein
MDKKVGSDEFSPEDIKDCWLKVARRAQAACSGNRGFGLLHLTVAVNENKAILWLPPGLEKIEPASLAQELEMSTETFISLAGLTARNGHKR